MKGEKVNYSFRVCSASSSFCLELFKIDSVFAQMLEFLFHAVSSYNRQSFKDAWVGTFSWHGGMSLVWVRLQKWLSIILSIWRGTLASVAFIKCQAGLIRKNCHPTKATVSSGFSSHFGQPEACSETANGALSRWDQHVNPAGQFSGSSKEGWSVWQKQISCQHKEQLMQSFGFHFFGSSAAWYHVGN